MSYSRRQTRSFTLGDDRVGHVTIGGTALPSVQSMTSCYTHDVETCLAEITKLSDAGADIVRVAVPARKDTEALAEIMKLTPVPIVADVHFHYKRALEAVEAGVHKIRLNPGNISDRDQVNAVIDDATKEIVFRDYVDISVAVASPRGLARKKSIENITCHDEIHERRNCHYEKYEKHH